MRPKGTGRTHLLLKSAAPLPEPTLRYDRLGDGLLRAIIVSITWRSKYVCGGAGAAARATQSRELALMCCVVQGPHPPDEGSRIGGARSMQLILWKERQRECCTQERDRTARNDWSAQVEGMRSAASGATRAGSRAQAHLGQYGLQLCPRATAQPRRCRQQDDDGRPPASPHDRLAGPQAALLLPDGSIPCACVLAGRCQASVLLSSGARAQAWARPQPTPRPAYSCSPAICISTEYCSCASGMAACQQPG